MKNAGGTFKTMGSSPGKSAFKADESVTSQLTGRPTTEEIVAKGKAEERWAGGNEKASKHTGRSLDSLVKTRKGLEKGSPEYNAIQNEINKSLGDSTRHEQQRKTKVDDMTIVKKGDGDDTNIKSRDAEGKKQNIKTRDGEVKGGEKKAETAAPVAEAPVAEESKGKGKGKAKIKAAIEKFKKKRAGKKAVKEGRKAEADYAKKISDQGKVKGSKAPKGTTYDPSDDSSNMPT